MRICPVRCDLQCPVDGRVTVLSFQSKYTTNSPTLAGWNVLIVLGGTRIGSKCMPDSTPPPAEPIGCFGAVSDVGKSYEQQKTSTRIQQMCFQHWLRTWRIRQETPFSHVLPVNYKVNSVRHYTPWPTKPTTGLGSLNCHRTTEHWHLLTPDFFHIRQSSAHHIKHCLSRANTHRIRSCTSKRWMAAELHKYDVCVTQRRSTGPSSAADRRLPDDKQQTGSSIYDCFLRAM